MKKKLFKFQVVEMDLGEGNQAYQVGVKAPNELQAYYLVAQEFPNYQTIDRITRYTKFPDAGPHA